jgi:hypothetical protein
MKNLVRKTQNLNSGWSSIFLNSKFEQVDGGRKVLFSHYIVYTYITYNRTKVKGNYET